MIGFKEFIGEVNSTKSLGFVDGTSHGYGKDSKVEILHFTGKSDSGRTYHMLKMKSPKGNIKQISIDHSLLKNTPDIKQKFKENSV